MCIIDVNYLISKYLNFSLPSTFIRNKIETKNNANLERFYQLRVFQQDDVCFMSDRISSTFCRLSQSLFRATPRNISAVAHLHLLMPTLVLPANQGSSTKTHRKVDAPARPSLNEGLSCSRSPLRNQWTVCFLPSPRTPDATPWTISLLLLPVIFPQRTLREAHSLN